MVVKPWQYLPRLGILFYYYRALAVSAEAWHSIPNLITPWHQVGSISKRTSLQKPKLQNLKLKFKKQSRTAKAQAPKTRATKAEVEQTETCRRAGVRDTL